MDGGVNNSSEETSNDRGAKCWQIEIARKEKPMFVHSIDENQWKTKLDRISERATLQKDTVFNNLGHAIDLKLLRDSYQQLDGRKAVGIDGVTKEAYGANVEDNLQDLLARIRKGAYKPQPSRLVEIPKEDGSSRPLAIACFEDKLVQKSIATILTKVFEPLFLPCSYGYREGLNGHEALRCLMKYCDRNSNGTIVEIDLQKYFTTIPHSALMKILEEKISDRIFLKLIEKLIRSPIMESGKAVINKRGCPQGSIVSPILANIYLHFVMDDWFHKIKTSHLKGRAELIRFADDMVFVFQHRTDAERFYEVLPKRLEKFGLELNGNKSSMIPSGQKAALEASKQGERIPTYKFLGFTCYWGKSRKGLWRLKFKSRSDRLREKLKALRVYLKENRACETNVMIKRIIRVVKGWVNYHAISDNQKRVRSFIYLSERAILRWIHRKGGKRKMNWNSFRRLLKRLGYPASFKTTSMFVAH